MRTVIIGDVHGRLEKLEALLERTGCLDGGERVAGTHVIQLGDLVNLGYGVSELAFLERAWPWIDEHLIGNHELPAVHWSPGSASFQGWDTRDPLAAQFVADRARSYRAASAVGDWLITHAGLSQFYWGLLDGGERSARELAGVINELWQSQPTEPDWHVELFEAIGEARGGWSRHPGIMWTDIGELLDDYDAIGFPLNQIVGHTPTGGPELHAGGQVWCIDAKPVLGDWGGVAALVTDDDGASLKLEWVR